MFEHIIGPVHFLVSRSFDSNIGFLDFGEDKILIDTGTGMFMSNLEKALSDYGTSLDSITDIILTHSHIDHIGGVIPILKQFSPRIHLHKAEADPINSGNMQFTLGDTFGADLSPFKIESVLKEGTLLSFGDYELKVMHTPGHSEGSVCLHIEELSVLFTGDTMFAGGSFGRVDFPTGSPEKIVRSLKRISELNFEIALAGHMGPVRQNAKRAALTSYQMASSMFRM